jgi:hypothetical protein
VGYYYGRDNTKKAGREFSKLFAEIQEAADNESEFINRSLEAAGPLGDADDEEASANIYAYLASQYDMESSNNALDTALRYSYRTLSQNIPANSKVALINVDSKRKNEGELILDELMVIFVNAGRYIIVDRRNIEAIKAEQNLQLSGDVDDDSMVSIGHFLGADVVITGTVNGLGKRRRLILKALDVETSRILAASSENI